MICLGSTCWNGLLEWSEALPNASLKCYSAVAAFGAVSSRLGGGLRRFGSLGCYLFRWAAFHLLTSYFYLVYSDLLLQHEEPLRHSTKSHGAGLHALSLFEIAHRPFSPARSRPRPNASPAAASLPSYRAKPCALDQRKSLVVESFLCRSAPAAKSRPPEARLWRLQAA